MLHKVTITQAYSVQGAHLVPMSTIREFLKAHAILVHVLVVQNLVTCHTWLQRPPAGLQVGVV